MRGPGTPGGRVPGQKRQSSTFVIVPLPQVDNATSGALRYMARTKQRRTYLPLTFTSHLPQIQPLADTVYSKHLFTYYLFIYFPAVAGTHLPTGASASPMKLKDIHFFRCPKPGEI